MTRSFSILAAVAALGVGGVALAQQDMDDQSFGQELWSQMMAANLVGEDSIRSRPYEGIEPHGAILEFLALPVTVDGRDGLAIVKKNYGGEDATVETIWADGREYLASVTVMYQREEGYDPDHNDWFWAKYNPDGSIDGAGRVESCITCHEAAAGGDYIYSYNIDAE